MTNAEKYKTAQERAEAFKKFCDAHKCISNVCTICQFAWLDLEAEEEKPEPCPFCGAECKTDYYNLGFVENCVRCGYRSEIKRSKAESISAHNRVAKMCKEGKK